MTISPPPAGPAAPAAGRRALLLAGLLAAVVVIALVAGGAVLAFRLLLGHEDRATAAYAPPESLAYVAVNTDPTSRAWLDAWQLARRAGIDDDLTRLPEQGLGEAGEDPSLWDELLRPAIGREVGIAVWQPAGQDTPDLALLVMVADEDAAVRAIERVMEGQSAEARSYRDVAYQLGDNDQAVGIVDEALVVATGADAIERVIDARRDAALSGQERFTSAAGRAAGDPLVFGYVDGPAIAAAVRSAAGYAELLDLDEATLASYETAGQATFTVTAQDDGLRVTTLTGGRPEGFPADPAGAVLAAEIPASTIFYLAGVDLYDAIWAPVAGPLEAARAALGDDSPLDAPATDDLRSLGDGLDESLLARLNGQYALALAARSDDGSPYGFSGEARFVSGVDDPAAVRAAVDDLAATLEEVGVPLTREVDGFSASGSGVPFFLDVASGERLSVSARFGDPLDGGTLADDPQFRSMIAAMPDDASMVGYLALDRLVGLVPEEEWAGLSTGARATLQSLGPLGWSVAPDGDGLRTDVLLLIVE